MKTTALTAWGLALAGCAGMADTTPPVPTAGTQFDGSYVGQDTLLSGVAFLCGAADLPEPIEVQNGQFAYPFQVNPPRVAPLPVQIFEDGTLAAKALAAALADAKAIAGALHQRGLSAPSIDAAGVAQPAAGSAPGLPPRPGHLDLLRTFRSSEAL